VDAFYRAIVVPAVSNLNMTPRTAVLVACCLAASTANAFSDEEIVLCDLGVSTQVRNANASFNVIYQLDLDSAGNVTRASPLRSDFLSDKTIVACLKRWKFSRPRRQVTVVFQWKHAEGWISAAVVDGGTTRTIRFEPGWASVADVRGSLLR
jgi:hypothetical protein